MKVVTIPFGFEELPVSERNSIVPICLPVADDEGRPIAWGWFDAVNHVQTPLRNLARSFLGDVWRVSELTESAVKTVWRTHGDDLGRSPSSRVYAQARWCAQDLSAGSARNRRGLNVALEQLNTTLQSRLLIDPCDYERQYRREIDLAILGNKLRAEGLQDVEQMLKLVRDGCNWREIGVQMDQKPDNLQKKFRRWINRASDLLGGDV